MTHHRKLHIAAALLAIAVPAAAQVTIERTESSFGPPPPAGVAISEAAIAAPLPEPALVPLAPPLPDAIHSGASNPSDEALADRVAAALAADARMHGATVTVAANSGKVSLAGSARSPEQAGHAENIARGVAGVFSVSGTLDSQGG